MGYILQITGARDSSRNSLKTFLECVIPDFLAHWHTSGKIMFSSMSAIYVLFSLRLKACELSQMAWSFQTLMCSVLALEPCARSDAFSSCKWVPQLWVLLFCTCIIPHPWSLLRCPSKDVSGQTTIFEWLYGYGNLLEQVWKTSANGISIAI